MGSLRLGIYKLFSCSPNIPRGLLSSKPIEKYGLLLLWNNFKINTELMPAKFLSIRSFVNSSKSANQNDCTNQILSRCSNRIAIKLAENFRNNRNNNSLN